MLCVAFSLWDRQSILILIDFVGVFDCCPIGLESSFTFAQLRCDYWPKTSLHCLGLADALFVLCYVIGSDRLLCLS